MIKSTKMKIDKIYFYLTAVFYFLLLFNPNTKTLVLFFFGYLLTILFVNKNLKLSLLLAYLASLPFPAGKTFEIEFVSAEALGIPLRTRGIDATFVISVKEILLAAMAFVIIRDFFLHREKYIYFDSLGVLLSLYFASFVVTSLLGSINPNVSLLFSLYELRPLILYWYVRQLIRDGESFLLPALAIFSSALLLEFGLAALQLVSGLQLGPVIQQNRGFSSEGDVELGQFVFRPVGTFFHPTNLTHFILSYGILFLPSIFFSLKGQANFGIFSFIFAIATILLTLSRGAWTSLGFTLATFLFMAEKKWHIRLKLVKTVKQVAFLGLPLAIVFLLVFVTPRLVNTFSFFGSSGGGATRTKQAAITWQIIRNHPLWGIGLEMDTLYSYLYYPSLETNIFREFPEPVHNFFLRILVQSGFIPLILLALISLVIFQKFFQSIYRERTTKNKLVLLSVALGVAGLYIYANAQPLFNLQDIVFLMLAYTYKANLDSIT